MAAACCEVKSGGADVGGARKDQVRVVIQHQGDFVTSAQSGT